jgi:hypothetical protein
MVEPRRLEADVDDAMYRRAVWRYWWDQQGIICLLCGGFVLLVVALNFVGSGDFAFSTLCLLTIAPVSISFAAWQLHSRFWRIRREVPETRTIFQIDAHGVMVRRGAQHFSTSWVNFASLRRYRDMWLLILGPHGFVVLPAAILTQETRDLVTSALTVAARRGRCARCGYDLRRIEMGRCPECGLDIDETTRRLAAALHVDRTSDPVEPSADTVASPSNGDAIEFRVDFHDDLFRRAFNHDLYRKWPVLVAVVAGLLVVEIVTDTPTGWNATLIRPLLWVVTLSILFVLLFRRTIWRINLKIRSNREHQIQLFRIDAAGIHVRTDNATSDAPWARFTSIRRYDDMWMVYEREAGYYAFPTEVLTDDVKAMLERNIPDE